MSAPRHASLGLALGLVMLFAQVAGASHYRLPASGITTKEEARQLASQKITTTKKLLKAAAKKRDRRTLAKSTGIAGKRLFELVSLCDLLRVDGIGPSVARLLTLSGAPDLSALKRQGSGSLLSQMKAANAKHGIMEVLPSQETLGAWIKSASGMPKLIEGKR